MEEFLKEIDVSAELQQAIVQIRDKAALGEFLKEHGCKATADEFTQFIHAQGEGEISDELAEQAAGGGLPWKDQVFR